MATERELRDQSKLVRNQAQTVGAITESMPEWIDNPGLVGGSKQARIVDGLYAQRDQAIALINALGDLADDLDRRADECALYRQRLAAWRVDVQQWEQAVATQRAAATIGLAFSHPGPVPSPPERPFPEAEAE